MMNYLVLTDKNELPSGYEKYIISDANNINAIAWCREHQVDFFVLPSSWPDDATYKRDLEYLEDVQQRMVSWLTPQLNEYHGTDFSDGQWFIMLGQWLVNYLTVLYDKYLKLKKICDMQISCRCELCDVDEVDIPLDYLEFHGWMAQEQFHLYLYTLVYQNMEGAREWIEAEFNIPYSRRRNAPKKSGYGRRYKILSPVFRTFKKVTGRMDRIVLTDAYGYLPDSVKRQAVIKGRGRVSSYRNYYHIDRAYLDGIIDGDSRPKAKVMDGADDFTIIVCKPVWKLLPSACVENFENVMRMMKDRYRYALQAEKIIYDYSGQASNEVHKAYLMVMKGKGAKLCDMQHGGGFGVDLSFQSDTEYKICDIFYSWGWTMDGKTCEFESVPVNKTLGVARRDKNTDKMLYAGYSRPKNMFSFQEIDIDNNSEREGEIGFFQSLSMKVKKYLVVRLYRNDFGWWSTEESLSKEVDGLSFNMGNRNTHSSLELISNYYGLLTSSKLMVSPKLSTTALEALALDVPILVKHSLLGIEAEAYEDLLELKRVGILVETWEELADKLNQIHDNVDEWWNEPARKAVTDKFQKKYAKTEKSGEKFWVDKLLEIK